MRCLQLNVPVIGKLFSVLEDGESVSSEEDLLYAVLDVLLYHKDPKSSCTLHSIKQSLCSPDSQKVSVGVLS